MHSIGQSLRAWRNVLFALFLREFQSKFNDKLGLGWAFIEPFVFVFALSYIRSLIRNGDVHSIPIFIFMMTGLVFVQSFMTGVNSISNGAKSTQPLFAFRQVLPINGVMVRGPIKLR